MESKQSVLTEGRIQNVGIKRNDSNSLSRKKDQSTFDSERPCYGPDDHSTEILCTKTILMSYNHTTLPQYIYIYIYIFLGAHTNFSIQNFKLSIEIEDSFKHYNHNILMSYDQTNKVHELR